MITEKTYKALIIIRDNPEITARYFANLMWPDSPAKNRHSNGGNGSQKGKGLWLSAGSFLAKLHKQGLLRHGGSVWNHRITPKGIVEINEFETNQ